MVLLFIIIIFLCIFVIFLTKNLNQIFFADWGGGSGVGGGALTPKQYARLSQLR